MIPPSRRRSAPLLIVVILLLAIGLIVGANLLERSTTSQNGSDSSSSLSSTSSLPSSASSMIGSTVQIALIALEDGGLQGPAVGCGDSVVTVPMAPSSTHPTQLENAIDTLISLSGSTISGNYNVFYQSNLTLSGATISGGVATIQLAGQLQLGGVCDNPRVEAQLMQTALAVPGVTSAQFFVNGQPLSQVLSLQ